MDNTTTNVQGSTAKEILEKQNGGFESPVYSEAQALAAMKEAVELAVDKAKNFHTKKDIINSLFPEKSTVGQ